MQQLASDASPQPEDERDLGNDNSLTTTPRKKLQHRNYQKILPLRRRSYLFHLGYQVVDDSKNTSSEFQLGTGKGSAFKICFLTLKNNLLQSIKLASNYRVGY